MYPKRDLVSSFLNWPLPQPSCLPVILPVTKNKDLGPAWTRALCYITSQKSANPLSSVFKLYPISDGSSSIPAFQFLGRSNKLPQTWLKTTDTCPFRVLKTRSVTLKCHQGRVPAEGSRGQSLICFTWLLVALEPLGLCQHRFKVSSPCSHHLPCVYLPESSLFHKDISHWI